MKGFLMRYFHHDMKKIEFKVISEEYYSSGNSQSLMNAQKITEWESTNGSIV